MDAAKRFGDVDVAVASGNINIAATGPNPDVPVVTSDFQVSSFGNIYLILNEEVVVSGARTGLGLNRKRALLFANLDKPRNIFPQLRFSRATSAKCPDDGVPRDGGDSAWRDDDHAVRTVEPKRAGVGMREIPGFLNIGSANEGGKLRRNNTNADCEQDCRQCKGRQDTFQVRAHRLF